MKKVKIILIFKLFFKYYIYNANCRNEGCKKFIDSVNSFVDGGTRNRIVLNKITQDPQQVLSLESEAYRVSMINDGRDLGALCRACFTSNGMTHKVIIIIKLQN